MKRYQKIIFVCTSNTFLSPLAETLYRYYREEEMPEAFSRGLVVLFSEPVNPKINVALSQHDIPICEHQNSRKLEPEDLTPYSLILTMTFSEKVTVMENYQQDNVYTLGEFVGEDTDIADPYGGEEEQYEKCFEDIERRVRMVIAQFRENGGEKQ